MRLRASRKGRTIRTALIVVEVFSCLLPRSSLGPVFSSNSACSGSPHGRAYWERSMSCHGCCSILPIYKPSTHSVKESPLISAKSPWSSARAFPCILLWSGHRSVRRWPGQRLRPRGASANREDALRPCGGWLSIMLCHHLKKTTALPGVLLFTLTFPHALRAQLVRENAAAPSRQASANKESENSPS